MRTTILMRCAGVLGLLFLVEDIVNWGKFNTNGFWFDENDEDKFRMTKLGCHVGNNGS